MRIGNAPISWGICEIPDWGPQLPYRRVLSEMAGAGYEGTELGPWGYFPTDPGELRDLLDEYGLAMAAAFVPLNLREEGRLEIELDQVQATARLLSALGAGHIVLADGGDPLRYKVAGRLDETRKHGLTPSQWKAMGERLDAVARVCLDMGLIPSFHSHGGTYVENPEEIERLAEVTSPDLLKLCLDTGHIAFGGGDPVALCKAFAGRIGHVHLKDIRRDLLEACLAEGRDYVAAAKADVFVELGEGTVDIAGIVAALKDAGYDGWIIVEQDRVIREGDDSAAAAIASRTYLRERFGL